jgi:hypothetical protein
VYEPLVGQDRGTHFAGLERKRRMSIAVIDRRKMWMKRGQVESTRH